MGLPKPPHSIIALQQKPFDTELEIHRSSYVASDSIACHISGTAQEIDLGGGFVDGYFVVDVTYLPVMAVGATFKIKLEGALDSSFASVYELAAVEVGDAGYAGQSQGTPSYSAPYGNFNFSEDQGTGIYVKTWDNLVGDTVMRYVRGYVRAGATPSTGIQFAAFLSKN